MTPDATPLLTGLLEQVSRSFYLTLRVLPGPVRRPIGLAYLLARATDTIADTGILPVAQRRDALQRLRGRILGEHDRPLDFGALAREQASASERVLLERAEEALAILHEFPVADRQLIRDVLTIITSGQDLDLQRFADAGSGRVIALASDVELDDYTYRVAGCVGGFWTKICRRHLFPNAPLDDVRLLEEGVRFGKGLQLVNILRDLPADLRQGRCYLPAEKLREVGLAPADLLRPEAEPKFRPLYHRYLGLAREHLAAGWNYTNTLPFRCVRVRLACAWPILIGARTLGRLGREDVLRPGARIKVTRSEVRGLLVRSVLWYPLPSAWRRLFARALE